MRMSNSPASAVGNLDHPGSTQFGPDVTLEWYRENAEPLRKLTPDCRHGPESAPGLCSLPCWPCLRAIPS